MYLNLVLEFVPETVYRIGKHYAKAGQRMPTLFVKLYVFQMCRALAHTHGLGVCHRDIKPQNLLVDTHTHRLKLCDFGSAKARAPPARCRRRRRRAARPDARARGAQMLVRGEPNIAYICSRYYRAPELIFGATDYTTAIDLWSVGCVMAELLLGQPLFPGESGVDQLVEIIKARPAPAPLRPGARRGPARRHPHARAGAGHSEPRGHPRDEPQLHGVQVPADQGARLVQDLLQAHPGRRGRPGAPRCSPDRALPSTMPGHCKVTELDVVLPWGRRGRRALNAGARALAGRAAAAVLAGAARDRAAGDDAPLLRRPARRGHAAAQRCAPGPHAARRAGPAGGR